MWVALGLLFSGCTNTSKETDTDTGPPDTGTLDTGASDSGTPDTGTAASCPPAIVLRGHGSPLGAGLGDTADRPTRSSSTGSPPLEGLSSTGPCTEAGRDTRGSPLND
jgi:hypothetical protein